MKSYKTQTVNRGTTIILDGGVEEAIDIGMSLKDTSDRGKFWYNSVKKSFKECCDDLKKGDPKFRDKVSEIMDDLVGVVDDIQPIFSQAHAGFKVDEDGITTTPELIASGDPLNMLKKKVTPFTLKRGKGDGAYRICINTDVFWFGDPADNCSLIGTLIVLLQRYAPVHIYIQQGWLGPSEKDGVTLFKLDYTSGIDINNLAFWICHEGKDIPFSWQINKALGRIHTGTSQNAEIECDLMLRGDWQQVVGINSYNLMKMLYTERLDYMAKWIALTGMKILTDDSPDLFPLVDRP